MHRGWLVAAVLIAAWGAAPGCGSRTAVLGELGGSDSGLSGSGSGGGAGSSSGSSSGGASGSSSGTIVPDSGACPAGESLCGGACCGGACTSGRCLVTLVADANAVTIAVDATSVYWIGGASGADVMSVPKNGGTPKVLATNQPAPTSTWGQALVVDSANVYWILGASILKVPLHGGASPVTLASGERPDSLAVDATTVYWSDEGYTRLGNVMSLPSSGGQATTLVSGRIRTQPGIAVDAANVYFIDPGYNSVDVKKVPIQGGAAVTIGSSPDPAYSLAALPLPVQAGQIASSVYWSAGVVGTPMTLGIFGAPVVGGPTVTLALDDVSAIAVDAANVYWTDLGALMSVPVGGGTPVTLAPGGGGAVAVDATSVYWIGPSPPNSPVPMGGPVMKLTPK